MIKVTFQDGVVCWVVTIFIRDQGTIKLNKNERRLRSGVDEMLNHVTLLTVIIFSFTFYKFFHKFPMKTSFQ